MSIFVFDAYGTLFDVHAAIARHRQEMGPDADRISTVWRTKQLEYSWTLTLAGHYTDFWTLTERALDYALVLVPGANQALRPKLLDAYFKLDAFPDARTTLKSLKAKGCMTNSVRASPIEKPDDQHVACISLFYRGFSATDGTPIKCLRRLPQVL